jgi:hypothetical protein
MTQQRKRSSAAVSNMPSPTIGQWGEFPSAAFSGGLLSVDHRLTENQVQVGFSYKFDSLVPAPVVTKY